MYILGTSLSVATLLFERAGVRAGRLLSGCGWDRPRLAIA